MVGGTIFHSLLHCRSKAYFFQNGHQECHFSSSTQLDSAPPGSELKRSTPTHPPAPQPQSARFSVQSMQLERETVCMCLREKKTCSHFPLAFCCVTYVLASSYLLLPFSISALRAMEEAQPGVRVALYRDGRRFDMVTSQITPGNVALAFGVSDRWCAVGIVAIAI